MVTRALRRGRPEDHSQEEVNVMVDQKDAESDRNDSLSLTSALEKGAISQRMQWLLETGKKTASLRNSLLTP